MKAIILAGGKGTRGKPFTDYFPKAMIPINDVPLIEHIVKHIRSHKIIDEIIIISDFTGLGEQIKHYFKNQKSIKFVQDSGNGTAGDLLHVSNLIKKDTDFLLWFVDNFCALNINDLVKYHREKNSLACIVTREQRKEETGYAIVKNGIITEFIEKPNVKLQNSECLGIYMINSEILNRIKKLSKSKKNLNLSFDIFEKLAKSKKISAFDIDKTAWLDVESPNVLERSERTVKNILKHMKN